MECMSIILIWCAIQWEVAHHSPSYSVDYLNNIININNIIKWRKFNAILLRLRKDARPPPLHLFAITYRLSMYLIGLPPKNTTKLEHKWRRSYCSTFKKDGALWWYSLALWFRLLRSLGWTTQLRSPSCRTARRRAGEWIKKTMRAHQK